MSNVYLAKVKIDGSDLVSEVHISISSLYENSEKTVLKLK